MAKTIQQVLGYVYLTSLVEEIKTGIPNMVPDEFYSTKDQCVADAVRHVRVAGTRQTARQSLYGAPPRRVAMKGLSEQDIKLLHFFEELPLPLREFLSLRDYDNYNVQQLGMQEVTRQALQFKTRFDNGRIGAMTSVLANGKIWYDVDGNLLPSSSSAVLTIDFGIPANNLNQLNSIIGASWATASTNIVTDIIEIKDVALSTTGYSLEGGYALHGKLISQYFSLNTSMKEFLYRNPAYNQKFIDTGEIPDGVMGLRWRRMSGSFYNDSTDTKQTFFGDDTITFCPPVDRSWWTFMEGSYPVPTTYSQIMASVEAAAASFDFKYGMFSYAYPIPAPPTACLVYGDTMLPWLKVPEAVFIADVTP